MENVKIISFQVDNVKRVKTVALEPTQNGLTIIGGNNGQGKTSVLDALVWGLAGDRYRPTAAQREGSVLPPNIKITLSNGIVVERRGENGSLKVTDPSGQRSGQRLLNEFISSLAVDLPSFMAESNKGKAKILLGILGIGDELVWLEADERRAYNERLYIGQSARAKKAHADELPHYEGLPEQPISAMELIRQQQDILARNGENQRKRNSLRDLRCRAEDIQARIARLASELETVMADIAIAEKTEKDLVDQSTAEIEASLANIEETNRRIRANLDKEAAMSEAERLQEQYDAKTREIDAICDKRLKLLNGTRMPLEGLSVEDGDLTYKGKKWDCMSGAEQLIVGTSIAKAINPSCGFVLMDKLEQMDLNTLNAFGAWLREQGLQVIATRVSTGSECTIIIEDGIAAEPAPAAAAKDWRNGF